MDVENVLDKMIDDLNAANDEFINSYFEEEFENSIKQEEIEELVTETNKNNEEQIEVSQINNEIIESDLLAVNNAEIADNLLDQTEDKIEEKPRSFSYNEILDRLDKKERIDINNTNDILDLIEKSNNSDEFFEELEKVSENDK